MRVLITGGAGFIGSNAARRFIERGDQVTLFDNLSRRGLQHDLARRHTLPGHGAPWRATGFWPSMTVQLRSDTSAVADTPSA